jgi:hypothetical protein
MNSNDLIQDKKLCLKSLGDFMAVDMVCKLWTWTKVIEMMNNAFTSYKLRQYIQYLRWWKRRCIWWCTQDDALKTMWQCNWGLMIVDVVVAHMNDDTQNKKNYKHLKQWKQCI